MCKGPVSNSVVQLREWVMREEAPEGCGVGSRTCGNCKNLDIRFELDGMLGWV
jgi:hypothetical protein